MSPDRHKNIQAQIRGVLGSSASSLVPVPEIERDSTEDAIRKLQVQIFHLSDAVHDLTAEVERLRG